MKEKGSGRIKFLGLPVKSRNMVVSLLEDIKGELKKGYPLQRFDLKAGSWHNVGLDEFLMYPEEHYLKIIRSPPRSEISERDLTRNIDALYAFLDRQERPKFEGTGRKGPR